MNFLNEELVYEQKMDKITEQLEELVLNAIIVALQKIEKKPWIQKILDSFANR